MADNDEQQAGKISEFRLLSDTGTSAIAKTYEAMAEGTITLADGTTTRFSDSDLTGHLDGYRGFDESGILSKAMSETITGRQYQVVIFDEREKSHPGVFAALGQK